MAFTTFALDGKLKEMTFLGLIAPHQVSSYKFVTNLLCMYILTPLYVCIYPWLPLTELQMTNLN